MAFSSELIARFNVGDSTKEVYRCYMVGVTTGTVQASSGVDYTKMMCRVMDLSTAGTAVTAVPNVQTGVITLASGVADNALTGESGGSAGASTFTATGAVVGQCLSGTGIAANTIVTSVSGTTVKVNKNLTAGVGTDIVGNTCAILTVDYYN